MDITRLLLRMAMRIRRPPSRQQVIVGGVVLLICLVIFAIEKVGYWPSSLTVTKPNFQIQR